MTASPAITVYDKGQLSYGTEPKTQNHTKRLTPSAAAATCGPLETGAGTGCPGTGDQADVRQDLP
jgi:hypothetical protein